MKILFAEDNTAVIGIYTEKLTTMGFEIGRKILPSKISAAGIVYKTLTHPNNGLAFHFVRSTKALDSVLLAEKFAVVLMDEFLDDDRNPTWKQTAHLAEQKTPPYIVLIGTQPHQQACEIQNHTTQLDKLFRTGKAELSSKEFERNWGIVQWLQEKPEPPVIATYARNPQNMFCLIS